MLLNRFQIQFPLQIHIFNPINFPIFGKITGGGIGIGWQIFDFFISCIGQLILNHL